MFNFKVKPLAAAIATTLTFSVVAQAQDTPPRESDNSITEEVVVHGVRAAEQNAREMERQNKIFSSVISQDDAGNFADQNVAEALQRLPGVTMQKNDGQGEFVNIRGMGAGFVGVSMNNSELASASSDGRAVGLNTISADLMGSIEVFKSLTPDMDLNSIAGRVNLNSVTAFDRGEDTLRLTLQGAMHEQRGEFSPKATLIGTKLFADDTVGIAVSLSHEERGTEVNQIVNDSGLRYIRPSRPGLGPNQFEGNQFTPLDYSQNYFFNFEDENELGADPWMDVPQMLTPNNFEVRQDESVRTRSAATVDLGWRPTTNSEYYARVSYTEYTDEELTLRERFNFGAGDARYIAFVDTDIEPAPDQGLPFGNLFAVGNADLQQRVAIQKAEDANTTYTLGGENIFAETWTLDYEYHNSSSERTNDDSRVQFRKRYLPMLGQLDKEDIIARVIASNQLGNLATAAGTDFPPSGVPGTNGSRTYRLGERYQPAMQYDNLNLEDGLREDDIEQIQVNLRKDLNGVVNYIQGGFQLKDRERRRDRAVWSVNPVDFSSLCGLTPEERVRADEDEAFKAEIEQLSTDCFSWQNTSIGLAGFETYTPRNERFDHDFVTTEDVEKLVHATRRIPLRLDPLRSGADSNSENYTVFEKSDEAYLMGQFQLSGTTSVIAGARYVKTEYGSTGFLTLKHDRFREDEGFARDIVMRLTDPDGGDFVTNEYDGVYPGVHLRWEATDRLLVRSALWTSYTRPSFGQASARANFNNRVKLCRDTPLNEGTDNERDRCSDNIQGELGIPVDSQKDFVSKIADQLSLAPSGNSLTLGNTDLHAMEAANFDASASWYGENGRFFELAIFYKDVSDLIVEVRGASIAREELPGNVRQALDQLDSTGGGSVDPEIFTNNVFKIDQDFIFHGVNTTINGDNAQVYGMEMSYSDFFDNGLFINSNLTLLDSKADAGETVRAEKTAMPNQADVTANLTLGWENNFVSVRLIGNYRSKILKQIGTCSQVDIDRDMQWAQLNDASNSNALPGAVGDGTNYSGRCQRWGDVFHDDTASLDFKATYNLTENIKFYFDALNLTEDVDVFYYRGNEHSSGNVLYKSEGLGRSYQAGVNIRF